MAKITSFDAVCNNSILSLLLRLLKLSNSEYKRMYLSFSSDNSAFILSVVSTDSTVSVSAVSWFWLSSIDSVLSMLLSFVESFFQVPQFCQKFAFLHLLAFPKYFILLAFSKFSQIYSLSWKFLMSNYLMCWIFGS
jgi:hypothetical protein